MNARPREPKSRALPTAPHPDMKFSNCGQIWVNAGFDQFPASDKTPLALAFQISPEFWRISAQRRSHSSKTIMLPTTPVYHLLSNILLHLYCYDRHCSLQCSLTPRCLSIIENINFVHFSSSPQVDFPVDFTRQNPSRVDTNR